ncbi:MAG: kelch repeat-containing protein [Bdellovibrionota bacterium]
MLRVFITLIAFTQMLMSSDASASWRVGNGGDALRLAFAKSKDSASRIVMKLKKQSFSSDIDATLIEWILSHQSALAADILASAHRWTLEEKPTCAWTVSSDGSDTKPNGALIDFSFPSCRKSISGFDQAVALLIHESVHHFGITNETFADEVAIAIVSAWKSGRTEWLSITSVDAPQARMQHSSLWTGELMIVYGGVADSSYEKNFNDGYTFCPQTFVWQKISSKNSPYRHHHIALWTGDSMIIWGGFAIHNGRSNWQNSGAIWNAKSNTWKQIVPPFGPSTTGEYSNVRQSQTAIWTGRELIVWGGLDDSGDPIGAIYDLANDSWRKISTLGAPIKKWGHTAVWADGKMLVWGGANADNQRSSSGAIYDLQTDSWTPISKEGEPIATERHSAVWTGTQMIVFGGFDSDSGMQGRGGIYTLDSNSWEIFESEAAMARTGQTAVWDGSDLLVFGGKSKRLRTYLNNVVAINPDSKIVSSKQGVNSPEARYYHSAVWTGSSLIIWGGSSKDGTLLADGGIYYP